jgi:hypothetical protein
MDEPSEMVERVARAAYLEYSGQEPEAEYAYWYGKDEGVPYDWRREADRTSVGAEGFLKCARAAIVAMRESTKTMTMAGSSTIVNHSWHGDFITSDSAGDVWEAMIDAALAKEE